MSTSEATSTLADLLDVAVASVGGAPRPGQVAMARAVADAIENREHLLVQAGTGTGKSLAYLVPALAHHKRVVIATATLALQRQLIVHDLPRIAAAVKPLLGREPTYALLKGRNNYVCLHRVAEGPPDDQDALFEPSATSQLGRDILRVREWAQETDTGDRDDLSPGVGDRAWNQVSVSARECLGVARCPQAAECFSEAAREHARLADIVVTNHALLAIDTFDSDVQVLPEHDVVIIDEAHEFVSRATGAASAELSPGPVGRAVRRVSRHVEQDAAEELAVASEAFNDALAVTPSGRLRDLPEQFSLALTRLRDTSRASISALTKKKDSEDEAARKQARGSLEAVYDVAERVVGGAVGPGHSSHDVVWIEKNDRTGAALHVAPLSLAERLRDRLFGPRPVVLTSATLMLGGDFGAAAQSVGLRPDERLQGDAKPEIDSLPWRALDVGSPFDYPKQGILYIAKHLPPPGRDGLRDDQLTEITDLVNAAGGRTLGLFSSMRGAQTAAEALRERVDHTVLCQGEDSLAELLRMFSADPRTCLFGTLSLWQGVNVPGPACQLVLIDRIPFPRPDDPLTTARQEAVAASGGNGFMAVAASHAALLLAQGAGRLIRSADDRGVVAVLDSRLATARYATYLRASLPPFWSTTDRSQVLRSLTAIDQAATADE